MLLIVNFGVNDRYDIFDEGEIESLRETETERVNKLTICR